VNCCETFDAGPRYTVAPKARRGVEMAAAVFSALRKPPHGLASAAMSFSESYMTRSHRLIPGFVAVIGLVAFAAAPAQAKVKHRHAPQAHAARPANFPVYVDRGSDRNPGGDNLYFSDTKSPHYIVGPAWFQRWE
jgi:hypothetical protein